MSKSDKVEATPKGKQNNAPPETENPEIVSKGKGRTTLTEPICKPIGIIFTNDVPADGGVVTGLLAVEGVAPVNCPITITSLNPNVLTPQKIAIVPSGSTTTSISAIYTPAGVVPVIYLFASSTCGTTAPVGVVLNAQAVKSALEGGAIQYTVTNLTYPKITANGTVVGQVTISPAAGANGVLVDIASDSAHFQPQRSPVLVAAGQTTAPVPTTVVLQSAPFVAHVAASCGLSSFGPIQVTVPTPTTKG